jgi:DNA replication and repair protein RecF
MITSLRLQNFRSYKDESFEFDPGVNIVVGPNGSGKTNLLEAVLVLARGGSYRVRDAELVRFGQPWARLDGAFQKNTRAVKLEPLGKTFLIDEKPFKRLSLERTLPVVFFEPNHLQLMTRGPDQRREYFDDLLERSLPAYKSLLSSYKRTLAQRNALLKHKRTHAAQQLFAWNIRLSELGSQIALARQNLTDEINANLAKTYSQIAKRKSRVEMKYDAQFPAGNYASRLLSKLEAGTSLDFERGFTAYGPHREDFSFYLAGQVASQTASRGETRSLLLALKIFELGLIENARGQKPIFLLDDVFSELDGSRRQALVARLKNHQTIITTTDAEAVLEYFSENHNLIPLSGVGSHQPGKNKLS